MLIFPWLNAYPRREDQRFHYHEGSALSTGGGRRAHLEAPLQFYYDPYLTTRDKKIKNNISLYTLGHKKAAFTIMPITKRLDREFRISCTLMKALTDSDTEE